MNLSSSRFLRVRGPFGLVALLGLASGAGCGSNPTDAAGGEGASGQVGPGASSGQGSSGDPTTSGGAPRGPACAAATAPPVDVVDASGAIVPDTYRRIAANYTGDEALRYRFGEDASCYHETPLERSTAYQPPDRICPAPGNYGDGFLYQIGPESCPVADGPGDFSSTQGITLYAADSPTDGGVNVLQLLSQGYDVYQSRPQTSWTMGSPIPWQLGDAAWIATQGGPVVAPIAAARSYRMPNGELNVEALTVFQSGLMGAFGENTGNNGYHTRLPAGLVPTAIALTNGNEFALVTFWDPQSLGGKLGIYSTTSCEESTEPMCLAHATLLSTYAIQHQPYPGFRHNASYTGAKLIGLIDLPELHAPTAISATSNYPGGWWTRGGQNVEPSTMDFSNEEHRKTFQAGGENEGKFSTSGFAVVLSQSERKATFLDLAPLFAYYKKMYFGARPDFEATRAIGDGPHQWPYTFEDTPEQRPTLVTTVSLAGRPTAVATARYKARAGDPGYDTLIATRDGTLTSFAVGGLVDGTGATAADVKPVGTLTVGQNPTAIAYRKVHVWDGPDPVSGSTEPVTLHEVMVVSRGDREIDFVKLDGLGESGTVYQRLTDSVMIDPIDAEDGDNHGTESYLLTVADFGGRQVINYRFGPIIMHTNGGARYGMGADGTATLERGGTFATAGRPFAISGANVP